MSPETVQQMLRRQSFEPFELRLTSREVHQVRHPENAALGRTRLVIMYPDTETDRMAICDLQHINAIEAARMSSTSTHGHTDPSIGYPVGISFRLLNHVDGFIFWFDCDMHENTIAEKWDDMRTTARSEAQRLHDDFPNELRLLGYMYVSETFCNLSAPAEHALLEREQLLSSLLREMEQERASLTSKRGLP